MTVSLDLALQRWRAEDAWETRVLARLGEQTLLVFRRATPSRGTAQRPSSEDAAWLELGHRGGLGKARVRLRELGLQRARFAGGGTAWGMNLDGPAREHEQLAGALRKILGVFGNPDEATLEVLCQRQAPPDNPALLEAMRAAAANQDDHTRRALYAALVNATLLVPLDPQTLDLPAPDQRPLRLEERSGQPVFGAFSDWDSLRQWEPRGHAFGPVHGVDFFAHVNDQGRGGVLINPRGFVGGELYPGEVSMMVDAVRQFYRKTLS